MFDNEPALVFALGLCLVAICFAVLVVFYALSNRFRKTGVDVGDVLLKRGKRETVYVVEKQGTVMDSLASVGLGYSGSCFCKGSLWGGTSQIALSFVYPRAQMRRDIKRGTMTKLGSFASLQDAKNFAKTQL